MVPVLDVPKGETCFYKKEQVNGDSGRVAAVWYQLPLIDLLFPSAVGFGSGHLAGMLLTGTGSDPAWGLLPIRPEGPIFGMPKSAIEISAFPHILPRQNQCRQRWRALLLRLRNPYWRVSDKLKSLQFAERDRDLCPTYWAGRRLLLKDRGLTGGFGRWFGGVLFWRSAGCAWPFSRNVVHRNG